MKRLLAFLLALSLASAQAGTTQPSTGGGGGGGTPGGSSGQIQYNNAGAFGGLMTIPVANGGTGATTAQGALQALEGQPPLYVTNYGAKCDGVTLTDVTTTASSNTITSASRTFVTADIGKYFVIPNANGTNSTTSGTITAVSGSTATVSPSGTSVAVSLTNATMYFGTDDAAAILAAANAASAAGGGLVVLPKGSCMLRTGLLWPSKVSLQGQGATQSALIWAYFGNGGTGMIYNFSGTASAPLQDMHFSDFEANAIAMATYSTVAKIFYMKYLLRPIFTRLYLHDSPATAIGVDFLTQAVITDNVIKNGGRLNNGSQAGGSGIGVATDNSTNSEGQQSALVANNHIYMSQGSRFGIFFENTSSSNPPVPGIAIRIIGNFIYSSNGHGIQDAGNIGTVIAGNSVIGNGAGTCLDGISIGNGSIPTTVGTQFLITGNNVQGMRNGIGIDYSANAYNAPVNGLVTENKLSGNVASGISITANSTIVLKDLKVANNVAYLNGSAGISLGGAAGMTDVDLLGNQLMNNGATTGNATQKAGISVNTPITRLQIAGNFAADNLSATQSYGLAVSTGNTLANALITGNNFVGNATSAYNNLGTITGLQTANMDGSPTIAAGTGAGTSPTVAITGNNQRGVITLTTGTSPSASATVATVTFGGAQAIAPSSCLLMPLNSPTALAVAMVSSTTPSTTAWTIADGGTPLTASTAYSWGYQCF